MQETLLVGMGNELLSKAGELVLALQRLDPGIRFSLREPRKLSVTNTDHAVISLHGNISGHDRPYLLLLQKTKATAQSALSLHKLHDNPKALGPEIAKSTDMESLASDVLCRIVGDHVYAELLAQTQRATANGEISGQVTERSGGPNTPNELVLIGEIEQPYRFQYPTIQKDGYQMRITAVVLPNYNNYEHTPLLPFGSPSPAPLFQILINEWQASLYHWKYKDGAAAVLKQYLDGNQIQTQFAEKRRDELEILMPDTRSPRGVKVMGRVCLSRHGGYQLFVEQNLLDLEGKPMAYLTTVMGLLQGQSLEKFRIIPEEPKDSQPMGVGVDLV